MEELLRETRQDVKEIKKMLHDHIVEETKDKADITKELAVMKKDVSLHRKLWGGLVGIVLTLSVFVVKQEWLK